MLNNREYRCIKLAEMFYFQTQCETFLIKWLVSNTHTSKCCEQFYNLSKALHDGNQRINGLGYTGKYRYFEKEISTGPINETCNYLASSYDFTEKIRKGIVKILDADFNDIIAEGIDVFDELAKDNPVIDLFNDVSDNAKHLLVSLNTTPEKLKNLSENVFRTHLNEYKEYNHEIIKDLYCATQVFKTEYENFKDEFNCGNICKFNDVIELCESLAVDYDNKHSIGLENVVVIDDEFKESPLFDNIKSSPQMSEMYIKEVKEGCDPFNEVYDFIIGKERILN